MCSVLLFVKPAFLRISFLFFTKNNHLFFHLTVVKYIYTKITKKPYRLYNCKEQGGLQKMESAQMKPPIEVRYQEELEALKACDSEKRPANWQLSPKAVRTFILGSKEPIVYKGKEIHIKKKFLGIMPYYWQRDR